MAELVCLSNTFVAVSIGIDMRHGWWLMDLIHLVVLICLFCVRLEKHRAGQIAVCLLLIVRWSVERAGERSVACLVMPRVWPTGSLSGALSDFSGAPPKNKLKLDKPLVQFTVLELRTLCRTHKLAATGNKTELFPRAFKFVQAQAGKAIGLFDVFVGEGCCINSSC